MMATDGLAGPTPRSPSRASTATMERRRGRGRVEVDPSGPVQPCDERRTDGRAWPPTQPTRPTHRCRATAPHGHGPPGRSSAPPRARHAAPVRCTSQPPTGADGTARAGGVHVSIHDYAEHQSPHPVKLNGPPEHEQRNFSTRDAAGTPHMWCKPCNFTAAGRSIRAWNHWRAQPSPDPRGLALICFESRPGLPARCGCGRALQLWNGDKAGRLPGMLRPFFFFC